MFALHHAHLMAARRHLGDDGTTFDAHILACVLANGRDEADTLGTSLVAATGLDATTLHHLIDVWFPTSDIEGTDTADLDAPELDPEEEMLRDLLLAHARGALARLLARVIARRAMRPDHLWQDLGLLERAELGRLLARHFPTLHAGNTMGMRWKKYFYRRLCEAEGFTLCTAPSCAVCVEFGVCFGAEDGESRMAQTRRDLDRIDLPAAAE